MSQKIVVQFCNSATGLKALSLQWKDLHGTVVDLIWNNDNTAEVVTLSFEGVA